MHKKCDVRREKDRGNTCQREEDTEQEVISWDYMRCKVPANHSVGVEVIWTPEVTPQLLSAEQALGKDSGVEGVRL